MGPPLNMERAPSMGSFSSGYGSSRVSWMEERQKSATRFSKVPKLFGRVSGDLILLTYLQNEGVSRHEPLQSFSVVFPLQHVKKPALQNQRFGVLRMAFRACKVFGTFEKQATGHEQLVNLALRGSLTPLDLKSCILRNALKSMAIKANAEVLFQELYS